MINASLSIRSYPNHNDMPKTTGSNSATIQTPKGEVFKNVQIAKMFGVSEPTAINWIKSSLDQKNQLELVEYRGKFHILNTPHNLAEMQHLSEKGRKYRNKVPTKRIDISSIGQFRQDHAFEILYHMEHLYRLPNKFGFLARSMADLERFFNPDSAVDTKYLQHKLLVQDSQQTWAGHMRRDKMVNIIVPGYASTYVYNSFLKEVCQKRHVKQFKFIGLSEDEVTAFRNQNQQAFEKNMPQVRFQTYVADIDADQAWSIFQKKSDEVNIVMLLGEVFYDIGFFVKVVRNINRTLTPGDFILTNIALNNPSYHTDFELFQSDSSLKDMRNVLNMTGIEIGEDFEFAHTYEGIDPTKKWYARTGSKQWSMHTNKEIHFHYIFDGVQRKFMWPKHSNIQIASYKLWQEDFSLEAAKLGYNVVSWNTNMEQTESLVLMQKVAEGTY